jgi:Ca2+-binding RTX toxin-like protein
VVGSQYGDTLLGDASLNGFAPSLGDDVVDGRGGFDSLDMGWGATGPVTVDLTAGTATGAGTDTLAGLEDLWGTQYDAMIGNASPNYFFGGAGADSLSGAGGNDRFEGGEGDDGDDSIDGGPGTDTVYYWNASGPVTVDLGAGTASGQGTDTVTGVENVFGSVYSDTLIGDAGPNFMIGDDGDDTISGGDGDDYLSGLAGTDSLDGGGGTDECWGETEVNCEL